MSTKYADFSDLEAMKTSIERAVRMGDSKASFGTFNREEILKKGSYQLMSQVVKDTPLGRNGSNWYYWQFRVTPPSSAYTLYGKDSRKGTLRMGWVKDHPEMGGDVKMSQVKAKVESTPIQKTGDELSMTFYNSAPYAAAVEYGHWVRYPWFWKKETLNHNRVAGKYYTQRGIWHSEEAVKKAVKKACVEMLTQVVKNK